MDEEGCRSMHWSLGCGYPPHPNLPSGGLGFHSTLDVQCLPGRSLRLAKTGSTFMFANVAKVAACNVGVRRLTPTYVLLAALVYGLMLSFLTPGMAGAADTLCAKVQMQVTQEATLERQAFDAHMRINNGLANIALQDVEVTVLFTDENDQPVVASSDPNNTSALFFIRVDSMENIDSVWATAP